MSTSKSILIDKSFIFAISIVNLYKELCNEQKEFVMSKQLLRSGTSIGANIREAKNAESTKDFIHKLGIAQKECDETQYWLDLLNQTQYISREKYITIFDEANQIYKMLRSTILTLKQKNA
jgi:four helix bundle protein